jgi:hypothetical protein
MYLIIVTLVLCSGCSTVNISSFHSYYDYKINIKHSGQISNATFIIPLPIKNNTPMIGPYILTQDDFIKDNVSVKLTQSPPGLNNSELNTIPGLNPYFLIIQIKQPITDDKYGDVYTFQKEILLHFDSPDFKVNTLRPIGNESIIQPKSGFFWEEPGLLQSHNGYRIDYQTVELPQKAWIYADFSASPSTMVEVSSSLEGYNGWYMGRDDAYLGNRYQDFIYKTFYGNTRGWFLTDGRFTAADGPYPNLSHPEWQKVLTNTTT